MKHLDKAKDVIGSPLIMVHENKVTFIVQDGVISEVGVNGVQAQDMLLFMRELFTSLNEEHPCRENALTITHIDEAYNWQTRRTMDRQIRSVEGKNLD
jgi:hypothetical protein